MTTPKVLTAVFLVASALSGIAAGAEIYKEVDARGNTVYSDRPRDAAAQRLDVKASKADPAAVAAEREALAKSREARQQAQAEAATEATRQRDVAAQRQANCEKARAYQQRVETAHRLYETDENGERRYYSAQEQDAAIAKARDQVKEWCDTDRP